MKDIKVLFASSEVSPFVKVGGLADVVGALPIELNKQDVDARVILPLYRKIKIKYQDELQFLGWKMVHMGWRSLYAGLFQLEKNGTIFYFVICILIFIIPCTSFKRKLYGLCLI